MSRLNVFRMSSVLLMFACGSLLGGCFHLKKKATLVPARYSLGEAKKLVLISATGQTKLKKDMVQELSKQLNFSKWWSFENRLKQGVEMRWAGDQAAMMPAYQSPKREEVFVHLDVRRWEVEKITKEKEVVEGESRRILKEVHYLGKAVFGVTTYDAQKRSILARKQYVGKINLEGAQATRERARNLALRQAVDQLVRDITPTYFLESVKLDQSQHDTEEAITAIKKGQFAKAADILEPMVSSFPKRSDVIYNLAIALEGLGKFSDAMPLYDRAIQMNKATYYKAARARCSRRLKDVERKLAMR